MITAITRNPWDNAKRGYLVSEWLEVLVVWQGQRDSEPRLLFPWEFIRADRRTKSVDFLIAGTYTSTQDVLSRGIDSQHAGAIGGVWIHRAPKVTCGECQSKLQDSAWWELSPEKLLRRDPILGCCHPHTKTEQAAQIKSLVARYEDLKESGNLVV